MRGKRYQSGATSRRMSSDSSMQSSRMCSPLRVEAFRQAYLHYISSRTIHDTAEQLVLGTLTVTWDMYTLLESSGGPGPRWPSIGASERSLSMCRAATARRA